MFIHISRYWVHAVQPSQCSPPVSMGDEPDQAPSHPASDHSRLGPRCDPAGFPLHLQIPSIGQTSQGGNNCPKQWARWKRWTSIRGLASGHEVNFTQQTKKQTRVCFAFLCLTNCLFRYWGITGGPVLSVWLALDDSLKENGALRVIPGISSALVFCFSFIQLAIKCAF